MPRPRKLAAAAALDIVRQTGCKCQPAVTFTATPRRGGVATATIVHHHSCPKASR